jgi:flavin reductase (DIM6/NTAB) family NADH-FMN oxidoreductase RutF/DNA-binding MarR family transcriptional regulator
MSESATTATTGTASTAPTPEAKRALRQSLGQFATGVAIMTAQAKEQSAGVTVNSFASVSLDPPLVLWSIAKTSQSYPVFMAASHFVIHVLTSDQMELASRFARSGAEKFAGLESKAGPSGAPLLDGCAAVFECAADTFHDAGDHTILIGRVERHQHQDRPLLLFAKGRYGLGVEHPDLPTQPGTGPTNGAEKPEMMIGLLRNAMLHYSAAFQRDREEAGLTIDQGRVLLALERQPGIDIDTIARRCFLSFEEAEATLGTLVRLGYAALRFDNTAVLPPAGTERLEGLRKRALAFEAEQFANIPPHEVAIVKRFLKRIIAAKER